MGILRTDKISGLETPTAAVTGSVYFDGSDDFLTLPDSCGFDSSVSYTVEMWVKDVEVPSGSSPFFTFGASGATNQTFNIDYTSAGNLRLDYYSNNINFPVNLNDGNWHHIAATYDGTTRRLFADGYLGASDTTTSGAYVADNVRVGRMNWISRFAKCYISNLRVVTGTALYTSDFTVPTHALEVIDGTILLCCNNKDNAAAIDHANIGASKSITVNGGAAVSTLSPSLTRDFTFGTEFKGVTTFDAQGYFVPPSGTTEQRGRGRGLFGGGDPGVNSINYITIASMGNGLDFGDLSESRLGLGSAASTTRAVLAGGYLGPANRDTIDFVTIATTGNAVSFGELVGTDRHEIAGASSSTRALFAGGSISASPNMSDEIDYVTIASLGDATDFGNLVLARRNMTGVMSPTRAVFCGGRNDTPAPSTQQEEMDYVTIATTGNALDFGDLTVARGRMGSVCSSTRGVIGGGEGSPADSNVIDYITIASTGNAQDFGDMIKISEGDNGGCSNSMRGVFGGHDVPGGKNTMEYVTISSTGNSQDFGDLLYTASRKSGCSDSHGGIS